MIFRKISTAYTLFFLFSLLFFIVSIYFIRKIPSPALGGLDIRAFYTGGKMLNDGVSSNFYNLETQYKWQKDIFNLPKKEYLMPFVNPPFVAIPFSLVSQYPVFVVYLLMAFFNFILAIIVFYLILKELKIFSSALITFLSYLLILSNIALWEALRQGQLSFVIFAGFVLSWFFLKRQKYFIAGLSLSLIFVRPHLVILPLFLFAWKREWKTLFGLLIGISLMIFASALATGFTSMQTYIEFLWSLSALGDSYTIHPKFEPTIRGFLQSLYGTNYLKGIVPAFIPIVLATIGALIYGWRGKVVTKVEKFNFQWAILIIVTLLTSLHTNAHDLLLAAFAMVILFRAFTKSFRPILLFYIFFFLIMVSGIFIYVPMVIVPLLFLMLILLIILLERRP